MYSQITVSGLALAGMFLVGLASGWNSFACTKCAKVTDLNEIRKLAGEVAT
jgi:hypothetical protein